MNIGGRQYRVPQYGFNLSFTRPLNCDCILVHPWCILVYPARYCTVLYFYVS